MNRINVFIMSFLSVALLGGCIKANKNEDITAKPDKVENYRCVGELVYDNTLVYIKEDDKYVPFIVLEFWDDSNCLLLRKYLLEEDQKYNVVGDYASYYGDSFIDKYLNEEYACLFSKEMQDIILMSRIEITAKASIGSNENKTEYIERKFFLLSANEVNAFLPYVTLKEGSTISYFKEILNRVATYENGNANNWYLRTPLVSSPNMFCAIGADGSIGSTGIKGFEGEYAGPVRPAFCIPATTKIVKGGEIVEGDDVYYIP